MAKKIRIEMTRRQAEAYNLLVCECGWPKNNHFTFGKRVCAHTTKCKGYREKARVGKLI